MIKLLYYKDRVHFAGNGRWNSKGTICNNDHKKRDLQQSTCKSLTQMTNNERHKCLEGVFLLVPHGPFSLLCLLKTGGSLSLDIKALFGWRVRVRFFLQMSVPPLFLKRGSIYIVYCSNMKLYIDLRINLRCRDLNRRRYEKPSLHID